jgi:xanthine dehydrogenase YagR molybdenum-binding subunit
MGNGSRTVLANAVAEVFGLSPHQIQVTLGDSHAPRGPLSGGSRTTNSVFYPAQVAAQEVQKKLLLAAQTSLQLKAAKLTPKGIVHAGGQVPWLELLRLVPPQSAVAARGRDPGFPTMPLAFGADDLMTGKGFSGAVHITEVEVDTRLGKIIPLQVWGGMAVGKIHAPALARSQCYGAVIQGLGFGLYEQKTIDLASGQNLTGNLEDYRIPGIGDTPQIEIHFLQEGFDHALGKGVGLSELATLAVAASLGNAVFNATGKRFYNLPILPADILGQFGAEVNL